MIIVNCTQGSAEWLQGHAGVITASMFSTARSKVNGLSKQQRVYVDAILAGHSEARARDLAEYKAPPRAEVVQRALDGESVGEPSGAALTYAFELAVERIGGAPLDGGFETWQMRRGHELEPEARMEHEIQTGLVVWSKRGAPLDGGFETWQMRRGHELEPEARMEHEIQTGLVVWSKRMTAYSAPAQTASLARMAARNTSAS